MSKIGLHTGVSFSDYLGWNAASNSRLSKLRQSPAHLRSFLNEPPDQTTAMLVGKATHAAVLEPDMFGERYVASGRCNFRTKKGSRCSYNGQYLLHTGEWACSTHVKQVSEDEVKDDVVVLTGDQVDMIHLIRKAVWSHKSARALLSAEGQVEVSGFWKDPEAGVHVKMRPDKLSEPFGACIDLKTTQDASRVTFERRDIYGRGYYRQGGLYVEGLKNLGSPIRHYIIIAVEKEPPYATATYRLTDGALDAGWEHSRALLKLYAKCVEEEDWPGYPDEVQEAALPAYAWAQIDDEIMEIEEVWL